ncbi:MAG: bifunctional tetrahydrofolate synthase/dihydrofolate synthase, partial [Planctomycetes bacterium]|nr:bifunctional tetrahydrofolate synthase/dihydrofolate synthase [Planctomycetota bacterium]
MSTPTPISNLETWLNQSFSREGTGNYDDMKLKPLQKVLEHLGTPPAPITVAGTKGKGSTVAFIESGLLAAGKTCLAFTSPHVSQLAERWRINGKIAEHTILIDVAGKVAAAELQAQEDLTYFERCFAIAVQLSSQLELDYFICEVGLGGRLDCANALDCQLAICCSISFDHCAVLGNTLTEIAT